MNQLKRLVAGVSVRRLLMVAMVCGALVMSSGSAFATGCTGLSSASTIGDGVACVLEYVDPFTILVAILGAFVPIIVLAWGIKGGFALVSRIVASFFSLLVRRG